MKSRKLLLVSGLVLALGTAVLLVEYLGSLHAAAAVVRTRTVYVAARDIPARAALTDAFVRPVQRPANEVDPNAVSSAAQLAGKYSLISIPTGSVITTPQISAGAAASLPTRLPPGMRAVSISIDRVKGVAGLIQPGDRVDVIAVPPRVGNEIPQAAAILRGALVLAMGNEVETVSATPSPENQNLTTVTLALTPPQVDLLAVADINTTLRLALRSPKESIRAYPPEPLVLGVPAAPAAPVAARPMVPPPPPPPRRQRDAAVTHPRVEIIDGDRVAAGGMAAR
jgi:pilus assembly protein CpaB